MRYLLTGGTGFVGANVIRHLLARGDEVVCVVRKPNLCLEGLPVQIAKVDLQDADALVKVAEGCDGIHHIAGIFDPGPGGEDAMRKLHVDATRVLLDVAKRAGVPRFLLCSSSITVGFGSRDNPGDEDTPIDPDAIYGRTGALRTYYESKREAEEMTAEAGGIIVNPDFVLGAWDIKPTSGMLLLTMAQRYVPAYPLGGKCFIDADDCALGHIYALDRGQPGRRYLLGNHNASYKEFMDLCAQAVGRRPPVIPVPSLAMRVGGLVGGLLQRADPHRFAGLEPHVLLAMQQERYRTGRRSWEELGVPRTPLPETIRKALSWFKEHGYY